MKTNAALETDGIWLDLEHTRIKLARAGGSNMKFNTAMETIARQHKRVIDLGLMSSKRGMELLHNVYAENVVLEWETLTAEKTADGKPIYKPGIGRPGDVIVEATVPNIIQTFLDVPDIFLMCKETAEGSQYFRQALLDDAVKN